MRRALVGLGTLTGIVYVIAGVVGGAWPRWDEAPASDQVIFVLFLVGGGALVLGGVRLVDRFPWLAAVLVAVGAALGALVLFWTIVVPVLAIGLVVLAVLDARRASATR